MENLRTRQILAYLKSKKSCSLGELMKRFRISSATIHRDAELLAQRGVVERVRGGLVYHDAPDSHGDAACYQDRVVANRSAKVLAAKKALAMIEEGDIIFLDSSTTVFELAMLLTHASFDHLTVITNAVPVMHLFRKFPAHWSLIGLGGNYDPQLNSILGMSALEQLSHFNVTKAFVSAFGLDDKTATTNHERQAEILRRVLDMADKHYLLVDHTKLGRKGLYRIAARGGFDAIVTD
ncbi:MAG: DeoR/GlpR transcriptional regulator [Kiritimatiellae bacterium]|nr:DeoR/GlpR transcriptional regulator [Kiritimatiellia bacterium]